MTDWSKINYDVLQTMNVNITRQLAREYIKQFDIKSDHFAGHSFQHNSITSIATILDDDGLHFSGMKSTYRDLYLLGILLRTNKYVKHVCCEDNIYLKLEKMLTNALA